MKPGCICLRRMQFTDTETCGPECDLPERRAYAQGARDGKAKRKAHPFRVAGGVVRTSYRHGYWDGAQGIDPWGSSLGR